MTRQEFIFSDLKRHRLARHIAFWVLWSLAFNLLFHFPVHVFKGWDTTGPGTKNFQELGPVLFFIKSLIVNSFFGVIVPQMAFIYVLFYWLLPSYYFKKRHPVLVGLVTSMVLVLFYFLAIAFKFSPAIYNNIAGTHPLGFSSFSSYYRIVLIDQVSSLPIVLGIALMIKLVKRWWEKQKETEQLTHEKTKAELKLLKAQVHPHFLFNTINNIYYFTLTNSTQAPVMIKKLSDLLNYILNECDQPLVPIEKEIQILQDYMALEKIRYAEQMQMTIEIEGNYEGKMIAPLLLIPFVENSFKHGASKMISRPWVKLLIGVENNRFRFIISNSKPANNELPAIKGNIGLRNVRKRLSLLYPGHHSLKLISDQDHYSVDLEVELEGIREDSTVTGNTNQVHMYAVA